jgi:hypothetical protein
MDLGIGVSMLRTEHASRARIAALGTIGLNFDTMLNASGYHPAIRKSDGAAWASPDTGAGGATGARVEADRGSGLIEISFNHKGRAKGDPWTIDRMRQDAQDARSTQTGDPSEGHEIQLRDCPDKRIDGDGLRFLLPKGRENLLFDNFDGEIVYRVFTIPPPRVPARVVFDGAPKRSAAVAYYNNRARIGSEAGDGFAASRHGIRIPRRRYCGDQV